MGNGLRQRRSMNNELERRELADRIKGEVKQLYNYIFYGMDPELQNFLFGYTNKRDAIKTYPQLKPIFSEGDPSIYVIDSPLSPTHGNIPDVNYGGPIGYEIYLILWNSSSKRRQQGEGFKYTIYHDGTGFIKEGSYEVKPSRFKGYNHFEETYKEERPLMRRDIQSLMGLLDLIQSTYKAVDPWVRKVG